MFSGFTGALQAFFTAIANISGWQAAKTEHQAETEIIENTKNSQRAVDAAERALLIADRYQSVMTLKDRLNYLHWCRIFRKYN